jgi:hypothetical protein
MLQSGKSSQRTETSETFTRRQELLETKTGMTSSAQGRSSAIAATNFAKGKNRQGTTETDLLNGGRVRFATSPVY